MFAWLFPALALAWCACVPDAAAQIVPGYGLVRTSTDSADVIAVDAAVVARASDSTRYVSRTRVDTASGDKYWLDGATFSQSIWQLDGRNMYHGAYTKSYGQSNGKYAVENSYPGPGGLIGFEITNNGIVYARANGQVCWNAQSGRLTAGDTFDAADSTLMVQGGAHIKGALLVRNGASFLSRAYGPTSFGRAASDSLMLATRAWADSIVRQATRAIAATMVPYDSTKTVSMNRHDTRFGNFALAAKSRLTIGTSVALTPSDVRRLYITSDTATRRQTDDVLRIQQDGTSRVTMALQETGIIDLPYQSFVYVVRSGDSTNQAITAAGDHILDFNEEYADTQQEWIPAWSNPRTTRRFTATRAGVYLVCCNVLVQTTGALNEQGTLYLFVRKNGQAFVKGQSDNSRIVGSRSLTITTTVELAAGDDITIGLHSEVQNSGTIVWRYSANTYLQIAKLK